MRTAVEMKSRSRPVRFRGRSYMAFALAPEMPLADWLADLDGAIEKSPGFFAGRPAVLDLAGLTMTSAAIALLVEDLARRDIRIMGIEGIEPAHTDPSLPPVLTSGRVSAASESAPEGAARTQTPTTASLTIDRPVRSGQTVFHPGGDVIVLGAVSSGAEIVAGGSIHVYGSLRGRAMAGATGDKRARIFCRKLEAELLAIAGYYRTVDDIAAEFRHRPIQAWLDGETMMIATLD